MKQSNRQLVRRYAVNEDDFEFVLVIRSYVYLWKHVLTVRHPFEHVVRRNASQWIPELISFSTLYLDNYRCGFLTPRTLRNIIVWQFPGVRRRYRTRCIALGSGLTFCGFETFSEYNISRGWFVYGFTRYSYNPKVRNSNKSLSAHAFREK